MVASPQFGGMCHSVFARSLGELQFLAGYYHFKLDVHLLCSESLITRARNILADGFLSSQANHLMFIDADIGFDANDVVELLILQIQNPHYQIIGGRYRLKTLALAWVFNSKVIVDADADEPQEVDGIGTGFMMIDRAVFQKFALAFPDYQYVPDCGPHPSGLGAFDGHRPIMQFFQAEIDPQSKRYLSEDYWFSKRCGEIGVQTWLCPWMKLKHVGGYIYE